MINIIKDKYGEFSDSWVSKISIINNQIQLIITCANKVNDYKYETIQLTFNRIESYVINKKHFEDNYVVKDALLKEENGLIIFDFEPLDFFDFLEENKDSTFKIICKEVNYQFLKEYP